MTSNGKKDKAGLSELPKKSVIHSRRWTEEDIIFFLKDSTPNNSILTVPDDPQVIFGARNYRIRLLKPYFLSQ